MGAFGAMSTVFEIQMCALVNYWDVLRYLLHESPETMGRHSSSSLLPSLIQSRPPLHTIDQSAHATTKPLTHCPYFVLTIALASPPLPKNLDRAVKPTCRTRTRIRNRIPASAPLSPLHSPIPPCDRPFLTSPLSRRNSVPGIGKRAFLYRRSLGVPRWFCLPTLYVCTCIHYVRVSGGLLCESDSWCLCYMTLRPHLFMCM